MGRTLIGNPKCKCGRVATRELDGRQVCTVCWSLASRRKREDTEELHAELAQLGIRSDIIARELERD